MTGNIDIITDLFKEIRQILDRFNNKSTSVFNKYKDTGFQAPLKEFKTSGTFGMVNGKMHPAIDARAPIGSPVYPIQGGIVTQINDPTNNALGGNTINIKHDDGITTSYYAHLSTVNVKIGQRVSKNTVIGTVGKSGNAAKTIAHVHLQVWQNGSLIDPAKLFYVPPYTNYSKDEKEYISEIAKINDEKFNSKFSKVKV